MFGFYIENRVYNGYNTGINLIKRTPSYNIEDMAQEFLPDYRKWSDYEG